MEELRQNGKIILHSDDGISIKMIFKKPHGEFSRSEICRVYPAHLNWGDGLSPGIIEHCRDGEVIGKGKIPNV
ncbi:DUF7688 family protein [Bacteroides hominis]|uniref:DUF7688 family protein n=1 Tax=Bacteroides hominis TaxID=2763023 RepID=UPI003D6D52E9